ncbi:hypothetical protein [Kribbella qitaiheensis]|nr:hypothetical protein [Kribbella qitaiheensis]
MTGLKGVRVGDPRGRWMSRRNGVRAGGPRVMTGSHDVRAGDPA